jgi:hypothetical protein
VTLRARARVMEVEVEVEVERDGASDRFGLILRYYLHLSF